eukprot:TRINITY_DN7270_c0_g1_i1.p1 TRINITY_DN7270_c0_g1~~TRINITY_DN7270_c0_g1_i1.p1  ORF type:complete len:177 (-),score=21.51 TRINITY_DN7270_c0_g1_i1:389-919(-)
MGCGSSTGMRPVLVNHVDGSSFEVWCDLGLQNGAELADVVARHASVAPGSFDLVFCGSKMQAVTDRTLLDMGFIASGGPSTVFLVPRDQAKGDVISLTLEQLGNGKGLLSCTNLVGDTVCSFEVDPEITSFQEVHDLVQERVGSHNGKMQLVCSGRVVHVHQEGKTHIGKLCSVAS